MVSDAKGFVFISVMSFQSTTLKSLLIDCPNLASNELLCDGLVANLTLTNVDLGFERCNRDGTQMCSKMIAALGDHPKVERLEINASKQFGDFSTGLMKLLASTATLQYFELFSYDSEEDEDQSRTTNYDPSLDAGNILKGIQQNRSLERIEIRGVPLLGPSILPGVFETLRQHPKLNNVNIEQHTSAEDLQVIAKLPRINFPTKVTLHPRWSGNYEKSKTAFTRVVLNHPEVYVENPIQCFFAGYGAYINKFNGYGGRYLLYQQKDAKEIPLGLWPLVIQHIMTEEGHGSPTANEKVGMVFEILKGPALAKRF
jgi:hypothetical protein